MLYLLKEVGQSEGQFSDEGGGLMPGEVPDDVPQHEEGLHHHLTAGGVAAAQHVGLQDVEVLHLRRDSRSEAESGNCPHRHFPPVPPFMWTGGHKLLQFSLRK